MILLYPLGLGKNLLSHEKNNKQQTIKILLILDTKKHKTRYV